jgi:hypothetical protein
MNLRIFAGLRSPLGDFPGSPKTSQGGTRSGTLARRRGTVERWAWLLALAGGLAATSGCSPKIGDKCTISTDCSLTGDRLCDPTQPGGYCTVFNCEPGRCPDDSVCVSFTEGSCTSSALARRFVRTFCMLVCESNDDCRAGYLCLDITNDPARQVVDQDPSSRKICTVVASMAAPMSTPDPPVCFSPDSGPPAADTGAPGEDGADASSADASSADATAEGADPADAPEAGDEPSAAQ